MKWGFGEGKWGPEVGGRGSMGPFLSGPQGQKIAHVPRRTVEAAEGGGRRRAG